MMSQSGNRIKQSVQCRVNQRYGTMIEALLPRPRAAATAESFSIPWEPAHPAGASATLGDTLHAILHDPVSYMDKSHIDGLRLTWPPSSRQTLNQMVINHYQLPVKVALPLRHDDFSLPLVRHWFVIRLAVFLLGCHALRGALPVGGVWLKLPVFAQRFAQLPPCKPLPDIAPGPVNEVTIWCEGVRCLLPFCQRLPVALMARLPLLFPVPITTQVVPASCTLAPNPRERAIFMHAIQQAIQHPDQPCHLTERAMLTEPRV